MLFLRSLTALGPSPAAPAGGVHGNADGPSTIDPSIQFNSVQSSPIPARAHQKHQRSSVPGPLAGRMALTSPFARHFSHFRFLTPPSTTNTTSDYVSNTCHNLLVNRCPYFLMYCPLSGSGYYLLLIIHVSYASYASPDHGAAESSLLIEINHVPQVFHLRVVRVWMPSATKVTAYRINMVLHHP